MSLSMSRASLVCPAGLSSPSTVWRHFNSLSFEKQGKKEGLNYATSSQRLGNESSAARTHLRLSLAGLQCSRIIYRVCAPSCELWLTGRRQKGVSFILFYSCPEPPPLCSPMAHQPTVCYSGSAAGRITAPGIYPHPNAWDM